MAQIIKSSKIVFGLLSIGILGLSCKKEPKPKTVSDNQPKQELVFDKGVKITNSNFVGTAWLQMLVDADSINRNSVGSVTFEPGARTNWHSHPNGQIIIAIDGKGYYQEKGGPKRILQKGDAVKCPPNIPHWHGACTDEEFIQIAITSRVDGPTEWLGPVSDTEYGAIVNQ